MRMQLQQFNVVMGEGEEGKPVAGAGFVLFLLGPPSLQWKRNGREGAVKRHQQENIVAT
jgi:hypothetical protein